MITPSPARTSHMLGTALLGFAVSSFASVDADLKRIELPSGFEISVYAIVPGARSLAVGNSLDTVFVGTRHDKVYAAVDRDNDNYAEDVTVMAEGLDVPNGVAVSADGWLYVAENTRIVSFAAPEFDPTTPVGPFVVYDGLPATDLHGWHYLNIGPDNKLYLALGAPCNVCDVEDPLGTIGRLDRDGGNFEIYARGVRNSVGLDWHPETRDLYFTNNGADLMGDDRPPDTLLRAPDKGLFFGFPWVASSGDTTPSEGYEDKQMPQELTPAIATFPAHSAPLGIYFYRGDMFPAQYQNVAFVAEHGSWNRTEPIGYQISMFRFDTEGNVTAHEIFAAGWLEKGRAWGRPVDIKALSDGSLLISDDFAGLIYRVTYRATE